MSKRKNKVLATVEQTAADTVTVTYAERKRRAAPMSPTDFKTALKAGIDGYRARKLVLDRALEESGILAPKDEARVAVTAIPLSAFDDVEKVAHPGHYFNEARCKKCHEPIECIDVVQHLSFSIGNVVKYSWRAGKKDPTKTLEDLRKARQYLDFEIARIERMAEEARKGGAR